MMYAPVVTRFLTYSIPVPPFARQYMSDVLRHPHVAEWIEFGAGRAVGDRTI